MIGPERGSRTKIRSHARLNFDVVKLQNYKPTLRNNLSIRFRSTVEVFSSCDEIVKVSFKPMSSALDALTKASPSGPNLQFWAWGCDVGAIQLWTELRETWLSEALPQQ